MSPSAIDLPLVVESKSEKMATPSMSAITVESFDASTVTVDEIVQSMIKNGGCYVRNMITPEEATAIEKDVRPFLGQDSNWQPDFWPRETRRVCGLAGKSTLFIDKIASHKLYEQVAKRFLTTKSKFWTGKIQSENVSNPQLNNTLVFSIGPGAKHQDLHRDDMIHHKMLPEITAEQYTFDRETAIGLFIAGKKTTKANGATRFVPRSHLQATETPPPEDTECAYAELNPGDGFFMLASCYHGGSANTTENEERLLYGCFMTRGWLRQVIIPLSAADY